MVKAESCGFVWNHFCCWKKNLTNLLLIKMNKLINNIVSKMEVTVLIYRNLE